MCVDCGGPSDKGYEVGEIIANEEFDNENNPDTIRLTKDALVELLAQAFDLGYISGNEDAAD